jgi:hypothetical protein
MEEGVQVLNIDEARKREKLAKLGLLKAQKEFTLATVDLHNLESAASPEVLKTANNTRKKHVRQTPEEEPAPPKKRRTTSDDEDWKCHGNVMLGDDNQGCPGNTEKHKVRDSDTKIKGVGYFGTCRACKNEMKAIKRKNKNN